MMRIISFLYWLGMFILNKTYRFKFVGLDNVAEARKKEKNVIFIFWHNSTFPLFYIYPILFPKEKATLFTTATSKGRIIAYIGEKFGLDHIDVPMARDFTGGAKGALQMLKAMGAGKDCLIAVDGPKGPIYKIKPGTIYLSQKTGKSIIPVVVSASAKITLGFRWDKYFIPLPFSKVVLAFGKPFKASLKANLATINKECRELEESLHSLTRQAKVKLKS